MFSFIGYLFILCLKILGVIVLTSILTAVILALIPVEFKFGLQNLNDEDDNLTFSIKWLFSAIILFASADISGHYEYGVILFGYPVFMKREILYDENDL